MPSKRIETLTLKTDYINIGKLEEFNYLGLTLDINLTWKNKAYCKKYQINVSKYLAC